MKHALAITAFALALASLCEAKDLSEKTEQEIEQLIRFVSESSCDFYRNGDWHPSLEAASHIRRKYEYVLKRGLIDTTEDFIEFSATKSSLSGKRYKVKCGTDDEMASSAWLLDELDRIRGDSKVR